MKIGQNVKLNTFWDIVTNVTNPDFIFYIILNVINGTDDISNFGSNDKNDIATKWKKKNLWQLSNIDQWNIQYGSIFSVLAALHTIMAKN